MGWGGRGVHEKPIYRGDCLKKLGMDSFQILEGAWQEKVGGGGVGGDTPMHTVIYICL